MMVLDLRDLVIFDHEFFPKFKIHMFLHESYKVMANCQIIDKKKRFAFELKVNKTFQRSKHNRE